MSIATNWGRDVFGLFFPKLCTLCKAQLFSEERHLCSSCINTLPQTNFEHQSPNALELKLKGRFDYKRALAMYYFNTEGGVQEILRQIKYRQNNFLATYLGELMAVKFETIFTEIDIIIPIPLHKKRIEERGYNQSSLIANGLSEIWDIPVDNDVVRRIKNTETQTHKKRAERVENMKHAFEWERVNHLTNKRILLIDDVITTGSTLESFILAAPKSIQGNFSILSLAAAIES